MPSSWCKAKHAENGSPDGHAKTPDIAGVRKRARALTQAGHVTAQQARDFAKSVPRAILPATSAECTLPRSPTRYSPDLPLAILPHASTTLVNHQAPANSTQDCKLGGRARDATEGLCCRRDVASKDWVPVLLSSSFPIPPAKCRSVTRISSAGRVRRSRCVPSARKRRHVLAVHHLGVSSLDHAEGRTLVPLPLSTCSTTPSTCHGEEHAPEWVVLLRPNMKSALQGGHPLTKRGCLLTAQSLSSRLRRTLFRGLDQAATDDHWPLVAQITFQRRYPRSSGSPTLRNRPDAYRMEVQTSAGATPHSPGDNPLLLLAVARFHHRTRTLALYCIHSPPPFLTRLGSSASSASAL